MSGSLKAGMTWERLLITFSEKLKTRSDQLFPKNTRIDEKVDFKMIMSDNYSRFLPHVLVSRNAHNYMHAQV